MFFHRSLQVKFVCTESTQRLFTSTFHHQGISWEFLVVVCHPVLQIPTLFQTEKCHFPHPFLDQTSKIHIRFQTWPLGRYYVIIT